MVHADHDVGEDQAEQLLERHLTHRCDLKACVTGLESGHSRDVHGEVGGGGRGRQVCERGRGVGGVGGGGGVCVHDTIGPGEAGCCRQVAASHSDHYRHVSLVTPYAATVCHSTVSVILTSSPSDHHHPVDIH